MRVTWIDNTRGVAIFIVVFCHVCIGLSRRGIDWYPELGQLFYQMGDNFGSQIFFFLTGLFTERSLRKRGKKDFILNKIETVVYPYVVFSLLQGSIEAALSRYTNMKISFSEVLTLFIMPRAQFWFLFALFLCLVVITVFYSNRFQTRHIAIGFALSVAAYLATPRWYDPPQAALVTHNLVYIVAGMLYARFDNFTVRPAALAVVAVIAFACNLWASLHPDYLQYRTLTLFIAFGCIAGSAGLGALIARTRIRVVEFFGKLSMEIYVLHILACAGCRMVLENFFGTRNWGIHLVLGIAAGLIVPVVLYRLAMRYGFKFLFVCPIHFSKRKSGGKRG